MNFINHFLFSFNLLYFIFGAKTEILILISFTLIFAVLIDADFITRIYVFGNKGKDLRTWIQEPFGLVLIGGTTGLVLNYFLGSPYFWLVLIPYASHIFLDYVGVHNVFPFSPFSKRKIKTGIIKPIVPFPKNIFNFRTLNENYVLVANVVVLLFLII